ncbi:hypothetical protein [Agromyces italicus]|uniref:hypothetical protein n=1 Tax=Agromyces italicus TaxID=279572 RepID=UPI0003B67FD5|nr:hypothetical protein [Agromyces italicus]
MAAIGALVAAVAAGVNAGKLFGIESGRDTVSRNSREQSQAEAVSVWIAACIGDRAPGSYGVVIKNASTNVVYDVEVAVLGAGGAELPTITLTVLPPGSYYLAESASSYGWEFASEVSNFDAEIRPVAKSKDRRVMVLRFRDAANLRWERLKNGPLQQLERVEAPIG